MADDAGIKGLKPSTKPDIASLAGLLIAVAGIMGGLILEGGKLSDITQLTAGMIVLGGTLGAVMVTTPLAVLLRAAGSMKTAFFETSLPLEAVITQIIGYATVARKNGIVSLETEVERIPDPFLKKSLTLAVDGMELKELRSMMELEMMIEEKRGEEVAKVFEAAGGYSPTIGIIGAVLGLIQVMKHLENIEEVGKGIAVAFVATVYGVAVANLLFLPMAGKIKSRVHHSVEAKELVLDGVCAIVEGMNPKLIEAKLQAYLHTGGAGKAKESKGAAPAGTAARAASA